MQIIQWSWTPQSPTLLNSWSQPNFFSISRWDLICMSKIRALTALAIGITGNAEVIISKIWTTGILMKHSIGHMSRFMRIFAVPTSLDGIFKENNKALSDSQQLPEDFHGLSANPQNTKLPVLRITVMVAPLSSHLAWKYDPWFPSLEPWYRSYKYPYTLSSNNQLSIWEL